jgi:hypothetical protein
MVAAVVVMDGTSGVKDNATARYTDPDRVDGPTGWLQPGDTVGITVGATAFLHTVPAEGQSIYMALSALADLINADVVENAGAAVAKNDEYDQCLHVSGAGMLSVDISLPIFVAA